MKVVGYQIMGAIELDDGTDEEPYFDMDPRSLIEHSTKCDLVEIFAVVEEQIVTLVPQEPDDAS